MSKYQDVMNKKSLIMKNALRLDYDKFENEGIGFDYEMMMSDSGYTLDDVFNIQQSFSVGHTPLIELNHLTSYARKFAREGYGARIFIKMRHKTSADLLKQDELRWRFIKLKN